jgi:hypothetical protein
MVHGDVKKFIADVGYRALPEIRTQFAQEDPEILDATLNFLLDRGGLKKIRFQGPTDPCDLYFVICQ